MPPTISPGGENDPSSAAPGRPPVREKIAFTGRDADVKTWLVMLLVVAGCSKAKSGRDAATDGRDDVVAVDTPADVAPVDAAPDTGSDAAPVDVPPADVSDSDAQVADANPVDVASDGFTSWTNCGWSGGSCVCDGLLTCAAVAGGTFYGLGSVQARACSFDGDVCEYVRFQEQEGGGVAQRCRARITGAACTNDYLTTSDCVEIFRCNLVMNNCPPDLIAPSVINCR
jgi:hypothetical protein